MADVKKDIINTIYKELFTVKFLHTGYGTSRQNFIADNIELEPDKATEKVFINHGMGYRFFNDTLICFIRTVKNELLSPPEPDVPYIKFSGNLLIRFLIKASPDFLNKTIVAATGAKESYQFTNRINAGTGGVISMHTGGVNDDDLEDIDTIKPEESCFGIIDIHGSGAVDATYELFNSAVDQELKNPAYSIPFTSKI